MLELRRAYRTLIERDPVLAALVAEYGRPSPFTWHYDGRTGDSKFAAMVLHILGQQISTAVAFHMYDRISVLTGGIPTAPAVRALTDEQLRGAGLSRAKVSYVRALAEAECTGGLDIEHVGERSDAEIIATLTAVRGIGTWSAEMFLLHNLCRADVFPAGDLGIRRAVERRWALPGLPAVRDVRERAAAWAPYRSYAAGLLWRSLSAPAKAS